jgi:3-dehydroquinate synthase
MSDTITIAVDAASASYTVEIGPGLLPQIGARLDTLLRAAHGSQAGLGSGKQRAFVITSSEIWRLWGDALVSGLPAPPTVLTIPAGEPHKRLSTLESLLEQLAGHGADRDSILIALGGGVIGDITGFLAAIYMRGIRYIAVPTTALAQIDSSLGGKTGVNLAAGKNLVGAFHHPLAVYADIGTLSTLPDAELRAGLQEAVKAGIIRDRALFDFLDTRHTAVLGGVGVSHEEHQTALTRVIASSVRVKAEVVAADERESGERMLLNFGHTLGHAIEAATHYTQLLHGEAVAWGMLAAIHIAHRRSLISLADAHHMAHVIRIYGPLKPFILDPHHIVALSAKDKKNRSGTRSFVLPTAIGQAIVVRDLSDAELLDAARQIALEASNLEVIV